MVSIDLPNDAASTVLIKRCLEALALYFTDETVAGGLRSWQGGRKWIFTTCPWNADHTNAAAFIVQLANGAIAAGCHHNGCVEKDWHALRDTIEPGWRERWTKGGPAFSSDEAREGKPAAGDAEEEEEAPLGTRPAADAVEPFPLEALPAVFRRAVESSAKALHCPPDYLAVPILTFAGAAIGASCEVEIKPGWR